MAEHQHGTMDTTAQEHAFNGFIRFLKWGVGIVIAILLFLALVNG